MKGKGKIQLALWALLFMMIIPLSAFAAEGQIEIGQTSRFPILIDQPGNYVLISDLMVSTPGIHGIQIDADNVVLDLNGQSLIGPGHKKGKEGGGIYAFQRNNIAVINGTVRGFVCGVSLSGTNHEVENIRACNNSSQGIKIEYSIITECTADNNGTHGLEADFCTIANCTTNNNGSSGLKADSCAITDCTADNNGSHGLNASSCTIANCTADSNGAHGAYTTGMGRVEGCNFKENKGYGLYIDIDTPAALASSTADNTGSTVDNKATIVTSKSLINGDGFKKSKKSGPHLNPVSSYAVNNVASNNTMGNFYSANPQPISVDEASHEF